MPLLINELVVTMIIDANIAGSGTPVGTAKNTDNATQQKEIIQQCVAQVLTILKEKNQR